MTEIKDIKVYDLEECIIASGYAMRTEPYDYLEEKVVASGYDDNFQPKPKFKKHLDRCIKLVQASKNSDIHCHDNFLTGIRVSFDIKYPQYLSPEMQRYHFFDIVTSMSKMHRIMQLDIKKSCNQYVTQTAIDNLKKCIVEYTELKEAYDNGVFTKAEHLDALYTAFMKVISNVPAGLELWMRVSTNYKQLQTIYYQRRHHKLKEDWGAVIKMIEELPYFQEFILGEPETEISSPSI